MKKILIIFSLIIAIFFATFSVLFYNVKNNTDLYFSLKQKIPQQQKKAIRDFLTKINSFFISDTEVFIFKKGKNINMQSMKYDNALKIFTNPNLIFTGPRAYFASNDKNLFLITGTGILMYPNLLNIDEAQEKIEFLKVSNNFEELFKKYKDENNFFLKTSMVKSILYDNGNLYVSAVQKINDSCYTHVIYKGALNLENIEFKEFYKFDECKPFYTDYLGGTISKYKDDKFLFTVGDWTVCEDERWMKVYPKGNCTERGAQSLSSDLGKIFSINKKTKKKVILSIGHDNPQGIIYDKVNNVIFSTEHGPQGGDELNINDNIDNNITNFGYPISSYGEHYGYPMDSIKYLYEEAPLYKSHKDHGFVEPIDYFVPSIGISDIDKYNNKLIVASLGAEIEQGDLSLYIYSLNENLEIKKREINKIYQRIRDIHIANDHVFLYLESTGSIGFFKIENLN